MVQSAPCISFQVRRKKRPQPRKVAAGEPGSGYVVFEHLAGAQAALDAQPHLICGSKVSLTNYVKPPKSSDLLSQSQPAWSRQPNPPEQPTQHASGASGQESLAHRRTTRRAALDSVGAGFEPVSDQYEQQHIFINSQTEPKTQRHLGEPAPLWAISRASVREQVSPHSEFRIQVERRVQAGFAADQYPSMTSEVICDTPQQQVSFVTIGSSRRKEFSSWIPQTACAEAVNQKGAPQLQPISCRKLQIESPQLDPNLRFNSESKHAFLRRTGRWPASLQH